jgi:CBS domain-containing protein
MDVRTLMRPDPVTLAVTDDLDIADDLMRLGRIRHLPVVDGSRLVGVVSQRDLLRAAVSSLLEADRESERAWLRNVRVATVMTSRVFTVPPWAPLQTAIDIMLDRKIGCLPVVDDDGKLVGLLTESDCLRQLRAVLQAGETRQALPELEPVG